MSRVHLIAADKPLPLCDMQEERTSTLVVSGEPHTISFLRGFRVAEHSYYRYAVDLLAYPIKPFQYELELELHEEDLIHLKRYLSQNFQSGETVELWSIWVGDCSKKRLPPHYSGHLQTFDMETLDQFLNPGMTGDFPDQIRMTITI